VGASGPVLAYDVGLPRQVSPKGLAILSRHGIPVLIQSARPVTIWRAWLAGGLAITCLVVIMAWLLKKRRAHECS
jgi:hypothetical protein